MMINHLSGIRITLAATIASTLFLGVSGSLGASGFPSIGKAGPFHKSKNFVIETQTNEVDLPLDTTEKASVLILDEQKVHARAIKKSTNSKKADEELELSRKSSVMGTTVKLDKLAPGTHKLKFGNAKKSNIRMLVSQPESPLTLEVRVTPLAARVNEQVVIEAHIVDNDLTTGSVVHATLPDGKKIILHDNGAGADLKAKDGIFTAKIKAPTVSGFKAVDIKFEAKGNKYQRNTVARIMVTAPITSIDEAIFEEKDGSFTVELKPATGHFRVVAIFGRDDTTLATTTRQIKLNGTTGSVLIKRHGAALAADQALIRVLNMKTLGLEHERLVSLAALQDPPPATPAKEHVLPASKAKVAFELGQ